MASNLTPPHNRGMTVLEREAFKAEWTTLAICAPSTAVKQLTTALEEYVFKRKLCRNETDNTHFFLYILVNC